MTKRSVFILLVLSLLLIPALPITISTVRAPAPWRLVDLAQPASPILLMGTLITLLMAWLVFPLAIGLMVRSWWWPVLCLVTVLITALAWNRGYAVFPPDGYGANADQVAAMLWIVPDALVLGSVAAVAGTVGIVCARWWDALPHTFRQWSTVAGLVTAVVPLVTIPIVMLTVPTRHASPVLEIVIMAIWAIAGVAWAFTGGWWLRHWWWALICLLAPLGVILAWGMPYAMARRFDPQSFAELLILLLGVIAALVAAGVAAVGVTAARRETHRLQQALRDAL